MNDRRKFMVGMGTGVFAAPFAAFTLPKSTLLRADRVIA
jgi:hypothetical protein